ncbi:hypothetical protein C9I49_22750 [Pseudomonas prosekii]|uniref:Uncharacterized protein n=1 Tax=Pseudomonas prosekii TaxID=1148509 RepID=A0A2U2D2V1_9PSED|nr:hypothetical protein C9I49_22750 [Pseudomonas prosekii]
MTWADILVIGEMTPERMQDLSQASSACSRSLGHLPSFNPATIYPTESTFGAGYSALLVTQVNKC